MGELSGKVNEATDKIKTGDRIKVDRGLLRVYVLEGGRYEL